jgi:hypothetical protein
MRDFLFTASRPALGPYALIFDGKWGSFHGCKADIDFAD